jgi:glycosyltransferase involved in cell wall biosynthesis
MKLIIQIPCLDEAEQLPGTLAELPRELPGIDEVEWLVVDDGSRDDTVAVARRLGVDHIVRLPRTTGLATAFQAGLDASLKLGADVVVNTDADNQYDARDIPKLLAPILAGEADMVIGNRQVHSLDHFSGLKKGLQRLGSTVVRRASGTRISDTTSGFRAYNREAALQVQVVSKFTYTLETIIQAGRMRVAVGEVPVRARATDRRSRLFPSLLSYVRRNATAILRSYALYEPLRVFFALAAIVCFAALVIFGRFIYFFLIGEGAGHVQSLILGAALFGAAAQLAALGILGDILAGSRVLQQRILERVRRIELQLGVKPSHYDPPDEGDPAGSRAPRSDQSQEERPLDEERDREVLKL